MEQTNKRPPSEAEALLYYLLSSGQFVSVMSDTAKPTAIYCVAVPDTIADRMQGWLPPEDVDMVATDAT